MGKKVWLIPLGLLLVIGLVAIGWFIRPVPPVHVVEPPIEQVVEPVEVIEWRIQSLMAAGTLGYETFVRFTERVEEMSGGRLVIEPFPCGAIVGPFEKLDAVRAGVFEGFHSVPVYWTGKHPAFPPFYGLVAGFPESWQYEAWFHEWGGIELARELYEPFDLFFVGPQMWGAESMHFRFHVDSIADFAGKKFRTTPGMTADFFDALGFAVVILPGGEIYPALDKGVIDGGEFMPLAINYELGFHEVANYFMKTGFFLPTAASEFVVRTDKWEALPPDLQAIVIAANREWSSEQWLTNYIANFEARASMLALENVEVAIPEHEMAVIKETAIEVWEKWAAKDPLAGRVVESQMEFMRYLGIIE
ncbi:TRAP transporter substrate-binding protein DctP [Thermodesulfovibrionales bacterium]|nr:TRAP transporter substrate-binding protein DctP [Thermodesulfovibrionales bacterium]